MKQQENLKLKLLACFSLILAVALIASLESLSTIHNVQRQVADMMSSGSRLDQARQITVAIANMRSAMRGVTLFTLQKNPDQVEKARALFDESAARIADAIQRADAADLSPEDRQALEGMRTGLEQWKDNFKVFAALCAVGKVEEAHLITLQKTTPIIDALEKSAVGISEASAASQRAATGVATEALEEIGSMTKLFAWGFAFLSALAGVGVYWIVAGLFKTLRGMAESLLAGAEQVAASGSELSSASQSLAQGSSEQAASLDATSASTEEISNLTGQNATLARECAVTMVRAQEIGRGGLEAVSQLAETMGEMKESSQKISKVLNVIDGVAFQTNILALNAAVEAARAGEAGAGFAVVADEVRSLAQRSAQAAKDTAELVEGNNSKVREAVTRLESVLGTLKQSAGIRAEVQGVAERLSDTTEKQSARIEHVVGAIAEMRQVTQRSAAGAEQSAAAAEELTHQSEELRDIAGKLTAMIGAGRRD
jgi:methyl-accepting chemotaxis protein/methyl-accepting chemotaxis protein-1 (serine sensor receptor)